MWQVHVVQHSNVAVGVDARALFDEAQRENDAVHHRGAHHGAWVAVAVLVHAHIEIEICLSCGRPVGSNHPNWVVLRGSRLIPAEESLVREHHARQVQRLHGRSSILPSGFSAVNLGARTGWKHRAWRSSELCRRSTLSVCRGVSVTAVSILARTSLVSGRDWPREPRRSYFSWFKRRRSQKLF